MLRNWPLAQEVMSKQREKPLFKLEVETLEIENEYYLSEERQELVVRKYQGKMLVGETMVHLPANSDTSAAEASVATEEMTNFQQWMAFLFGI